MGVDVALLAFLWFRQSILSIIYGFAVVGQEKENGGFLYNIHTAGDGLAENHSWPGPAESDCWWMVIGKMYFSLCAMGYLTPHQANQLCKHYTTNALINISNLILTIILNNFKIKYKWLNLPKKKISIYPIKTKNHRLDFLPCFTKPRKIK